MIPILYAGNETNFTSNGLGRLSDAISCKVTEERNGVFELEMTYPITGVHYDDIQENRIIYARTEDGGNAQAFIIYRITRPINGIITIDAQHISYLLNGIPVMPFNGSSLADTMSKIASNAVITCPFTFYTDISRSVAFTFSTVRSIRSLLGGEDGSILEVYGGYDYKFDNFQVRLLANRGSDNGVSLRYGKNLTELKNITNMTNVYTGIVPYWQSEQKTVYLTNPVVLSGHENEYPYKIIKTVDFSTDFEDEPTQAQLLAKAQSYLSQNEGWKLKNNITVSFVNLAETEDYKDIAPLERVKLCDTVNVRYSRLGVNIKTRVIKTVYNVLLERYDSIELGESTTDLTKALNETLIEQANLPDKSFLRAAIENATKLIQGGLGGHVVFNTNADGEPEEILIMDTDDISTAVNVIRFNLGGIGFSNNGYNGPFATAWTIDGSFYADFITAGNLNAALITVGILKDAQNKNYWNMATGEFKLSANAAVGNSTVASVSDVSAGDSATLSAANTAADNKITAYNNALNQQAVFNKLTNNGQLQGIYMENGELYINGSYIKTGVLDADLITTGTIEDSQQSNYWNLATGAFKLSSATQVGNSTVASVSDVSAGDSATLTAANSAADSKISTYDTNLNQQAVFNKLTNSGQLQGIYMENGELYINGEYIKADSIKANSLDVDESFSLHGDFTSYKAGGSDPEYFKLMMDASSLKFYADGQLAGKIEPVYYGSRYSIALTCYDRDTGQILSSIGPSGVSVTGNGNGDITTDQLYVNGFNGPSIFYREVEFEGSGGAVVTFKGSVYDANGSTVFVSDKRKKKNIKDLAIEKARSFIMALKPREFKFKKEIANAGRKHHGFIAQEVKEVMHEDWGLYVEDKSKDYIGLRYTEIIADMVAVIQDQQKRIEALERRVNDITNNKS